MLSGKHRGWVEEDGIPGTKNTADGPRPRLRDPFPLGYLEALGSIEVVIIPHDTRDGMRKAYSITGQGKKIISLFKRREETDSEILGKIRE